MPNYTYTIFDADPSSSSGTAWHDHQDEPIEAESAAAASAAVYAIMSSVAEGLKPEDGYDVGQTLYAYVWSDERSIVGSPTYEITAEDLGVDETTLDQSSDEVES